MPNDDPDRPPHASRARRETFSLPRSTSDGSAELRRRQLQRRRWFGVGGALVFLVTVGVVTELVVSAGGGDDGRGGDGGSAGTDVAVAASSAAEASEASTAAEQTEPGPVPGDAPTGGDVGELPDGADVTASGDGEFHAVGRAGTTAGDPDSDDSDDYSYVVEVEDGIDTASFGGGDAFSATVDATLSDPRSWISDGNYAFRHISVRSRETPDLRIRLVSPETTREICGGQIDLETSCFIRGPDAPDADGESSGDADAGRVIINAARWVRGAATFEGDLGSYRQYVVNHEVGHGLGYARHQPCPDDGVLAPVMMQQTLSLNNGELLDLEAGAEYDDVGQDDTCRPNAWPFPHGRSEGEAVDVRD